MKCFCNELSYDCSECEDISSFKKLNIIQKIKIRSYHDHILNKETDRKEFKELTKFMLENDLDTSLVRFL